jgi:branched-chain amino acid transport system permease protein
MNAALNLLPHLANGISLGLLLALIALGFMLIVGVMETINLAHGSLFALGMYAALFLLAPRLGWWPELQAAYLGLPIGTRYAIALLGAPILVGLFGLVLELCLRRTYGKDPLYGLLLTFGAALVIEEGIRIVWGSNEQQLALPAAISGAFSVGDLLYSRYRVFASAFAVLAILALWAFLEKTPYGAIIKAGAHDSEMVRALGINLGRLRAAVFALGVALAALAAGRRRRGRAGLPDHRARRRRLAVGCGHRRPAGRHGRRAGRRLCVGMVLDVDVPALHRRRDLSRPRPVRQEERARHLTHPRCAFGAPPQGGDAGGPAEPDPRRLLGSTGSGRRIRA